MLALSSVSAAAAAETCCWCDSDTPESAQSIVGADSKTYSLVFSDEFNQVGRKFGNGEDSKWTALDIGDTSNLGAAFYLSEQATVVEDKEFDVTALQILTTNTSHVGDSPEGETGIFMPYSSAMLQGWNKVRCALG